MGLTEDLLRQEQERRRQAAAAAQQGVSRQRSGPGQGDGAARRPQRPGPARKWPLRDWINRGKFKAIGPRPAQVYAVLLVLSNPKSRQYSGGRERIAEACGCDEATVTRSLDTLAVHGLIRRQQTRQTVNGSVRSGLFVWILEPGEEAVVADTDARLPGAELDAQKCAPTENAPGSNPVGAQK